MRGLKGLIKTSIGVLIIVINFMVGVILGGWFLFLDPIIACINSFSIRLMILAIAKCIIAIPVCKMIIRIGNTIGKMMILDWF